MARHPNQKSTWDVSMGKRRKAADQKKESTASLGATLEALQTVQASRPMRPPGKR